MSKNSGGQYFDNVGTIHAQMAILKRHVELLSDAKTLRHWSDVADEADTVGRVAEIIKSLVSAL